MMSTDSKSVCGSRSCSTLTSDYFEHRILNDNLDHRLARFLQSKDRQADYGDLLSHVGFWLATWGAQGWCDDHIAAGRPPSDRTLTRWLRHKWHHTKYQSAQDALSRAYGLRTQTEIRMREEQGTKFIIHPEAHRVDPDAPQLVLDIEVYTKEAQKAKPKIYGTVSGHHFIAATTPECMAEHWDLATDILTIVKARASDRYLRVAEYLFGGLSLAEVAALEGISEGRANKLFQRVRATLRYGAQLSQTSLGVLRIISEEPYSTASEIKEEVEDGDMALALLQRRGLIQEEKGSSYIATDRGRAAIETGVI